MVGGMIPTYCRGVNLGDRALFPLYAECEQLDVPIGAHATGGETGDLGRHPSFLGIHICSHVPEQMVSLTSVVLGGVFEQFKKLRYGFLEAGCGWVPFWMEHMDEEWEKRGSVEAPLCREKPSDYVKNRGWFFALGNFLQAEKADARYGRQRRKGLQASRTKMVFAEKVAASPCDADFEFAGPV